MAQDLGDDDELLASPNEAQVAVLASKVVQGTALPHSQRALVAIGRECRTTRSHRRRQTTLALFDLRRDPQRAEKDPQDLSDDQHRRAHQLAGI
ncbi:MAG: hypothetical protein H6707_04175 [Deltaproteobacteria bacterium]|nr:hypothetical protein [Deltaproteobacteria bacterium]